jgi:hypothetical protein
MGTAQGAFQLAVSACPGLSLHHPHWGLINHYTVDSAAAGAAKSAAATTTVAARTLMGFMDDCLHSEHCRRSTIFLVVLACDPSAQPRY